MTANYRDTRRYAAPRARIFQACIDVMQPSGLLVSASDPQSWTINAISSDGPFSHRPDSGFLEEIGLILLGRVGVLSKFRERISIEVDDNGNVHALSVSEPSTVVLDQGRNREHVVMLWKALDEVLLRPQGVFVKIKNDNSVTITGNTSPVQNASPHAQQQSAGPGARQQMGHHSGDLDDVLSFLTEVAASIDRLELAQDESAQLQAEMATIRAQAVSPKPKRHVIRESLQSVRAILEHAGGGAATVGLLDLLHHLNI